MILKSFPTRSWIMHPRAWSDSLSLLARALVIGPLETWMTFLRAVWSALSPSWEPFQDINKGPLLAQLYVPDACPYRPTCTQRIHKKTRCKFYLTDPGPAASYHVVKNTAIGILLRWARSNRNVKVSWKETPRNKLFNPIKCVVESYSREQSQQRA